MATGPVDLFVDTDMLRELGAELQSLITALDGGGCRAAADPAAMGGDDVAGAVDRFLRRWDDGRGSAIEKLRGCLAYVQNAIDGYDNTEGCLERASLPGPLADLDPGRRP